MKEINIASNQESQTVFKFVKKYLSQAPLSFIEKLFRKKDVKVNGKRVDKSFILTEGDFVQIYVSDEQLNDFGDLMYFYNYFDEPQKVLQFKEFMMYLNFGIKKSYGSCQGEALTLKKF